MMDLPQLPAPGGRIDLDRPFKPVRIAVLTVSDTRTRDSDTSGDILADRVESAGHVLADRKLLRDDAKAIRKQVEAWNFDPGVDASFPQAARA